MSEMNEFAEWLRREMQLRKTSGNALARAIGANHDTVAQWLTSQCFPRPKNVEALANYFGANAAFLYGLMGTARRNNLISKAGGSPEATAENELDEAEIAADEQQFLLLIRTLNPAQRSQAFAIITALRDNPRSAEQGNPRSAQKERESEKQES